MTRDFGCTELYGFVAARRLAFTTFASIEFDGTLTGQAHEGDALYRVGAGPVREVRVLNSPISQSPITYQYRGGGAQIAASRPFYPGTPRGALQLSWRHVAELA